MTALDGSDPDPEAETVTLEEADANNDGVYNEEELRALTKAQLLDLAGILNVESVTASNTKAQIIAAILAAQESALNPGADQSQEG